MTRGIRSLAPDKPDSTGHSLQLPMRMFLIIFISPLIIPWQHLLFTFPIHVFLAAYGSCHKVSFLDGCCCSSTGFYLGCVGIYCADWYKGQSREDCWMPLDDMFLSRSVSKTWPPSCCRSTLTKACPSAFWKL